MENFVETFKVVPVSVPQNYSGTATMTYEYINMKHAKKATYIINMGTIATGGAVRFGVATSKSGTTGTTTVASMDLGMPHYWISNAATAAASCDVYTKTTVTADTFNIASTMSSKLIILEVDANKMGTFSKSSVTYDANYLTLLVTTGGADFVSCECILTGYRYKEDAPASVLA